MDLSIIVVNWNVADLLRCCLASVVQECQGAPELLWEAIEALPQIRYNQKNNLETLSILKDDIIFQFTQIASNDATIL